MGAYSLQLECLSCSNRRNFMLHGEAGAQLLTQADLMTVSRRAEITCGRCGSGSLIRSWADSMPDATAPYIPRRRRRRTSKVVATLAGAQ